MTSCANVIRNVKLSKEYDIFALAGTITGIITYRSMGMETLFNENYVKKLLRSLNKTDFYQKDVMIKIMKIVSDMAHDECED